MSKNSTDIRKILEVISFVFFKAYNSKKKEMTGDNIPLPEIPKEFFPLLFFKSNLFYYAIVTILSIGILRDVLNLSHPSKDLKKSPLIPIFPEKLPTKRVLALHLSSPYYVNQYVIFKQKNKNNLSPVHINHGEVGQIIKKLEEWDHAMVDFSIDIPSRFQELKTKFIADQSDNEAILIVEEI